MFITRFFEVYGPIVPFIDRETIEPLLYSLLVSKELYSVLNSSQLNQTDLIAILLITLRLGSLSYYGDTQKGDNPITKNHVDYASKLLLAPVSFNKYSKTKIHALLLLFIYRRNCPEGDDSNYESNIILLVIVQSARKLGMNRDLKTYSTIHYSSKEIYSWHITWLYICYLDSHQAYTHGLVPTIREYELHDLDYKAAAQFYRPSILRILKVMNNASKVIIPFLDGKIQNRVVNKNEVQELLQEVQKTLNSCRTIDQLCSHTTTIPQFDQKRTEMALELNVRLDLLYKEHSLYLLLYLAAEQNDSFASESEKQEYFSLSFEKALVVFKLASEFFQNPKLFFGLELELNVSCRLMATAKNMIPTLAACMTKIKRDHYLVLDALLSFNCPDSVGLIDWLSSDTENSDESVCRNFIERFHQFYTLLESDYGYYSYSCFKTCMLSKIFLSYAHNILPQYCEALEQTSTDDMAWFNNISLGLQLEFWENELQIGPGIELDTNSFNTDLN